MLEPWFWCLSPGFGPWEIQWDHFLTPQINLSGRHFWVNGEGNRFFAPKSEFFEQKRAPDKQKGFRLSFATSDINNWHRNNTKMVICHFQRQGEAGRFHFCKNLPQNWLSGGQNRKIYAWKNYFRKEIFKGVKIYYISPIKMAKKT